MAFEGEVQSEFVFIYKLRQFLALDFGAFLLQQVVV